MNTRLTELRERLRPLGLEADMGGRTADEWVDLVVRVSRASGATRTYAVLVKRAVPAELATAPHPHASLPTLVVARSIAEQAADLLRARGIDYVDEAGNAHMAWDDVLIDVGSPPRRQSRRPRPADDDRVVLAREVRGQALR